MEIKEEKSGFLVVDREVFAEKMVVSHQSFCLQKSVDGGGDLVNLWVGGSWPFIHHPLDVSLMSEVSHSRAVDNSCEEAEDQADQIHVHSNFFVRNLRVCEFEWVSHKAERFYTLRKERSSTPKWQVVPCRVRKKPGDASMKNVSLSKLKWNTWNSLINSKIWQRK